MDPYPSSAVAQSSMTASSTMRMPYRHCHPLLLPPHLCVTSPTRPLCHAVLPYRPRHDKPAGCLDISRFMPAMRPDIHTP